MSKRVAEVLVETLQAADVKTCCGIIGDTLNRRCYSFLPNYTCRGTPLGTKFLSSRQMSNGRGPVSTQLFLNN
jgi:hypothetical protein